MANQDILINWAPQETRVAVVENGAVQELHIERALERAAPPPAEQPPDPAQMLMENMRGPR